MRSKRKTSPVFTTTSPSKRREQWNHNYVVASSDEEDGSANEIEDEFSDEEWEIKGTKENASEFAIEVWEGKKRKAQFVSKCSSAHPSSQSQSHNLGSDQRAETPEQEPLLQQPLNSPLFVSLDTVSEAHSPETNETPPLDLATGSTSRRANRELPTVRNCESVFEYYPRAPIPSEYCLPGEFEEQSGSVTQREAITGAVYTRETRNPNLTKENSNHFGSFRQSTAVQASPRSEIPETPSIPLALPQSQIRGTGPRVGTFGSQQSAGLNRLPLSNLSLDYLSSPHTSADDPNSAFGTNPSPQRVYSPIYTASVPESAPANTIQLLSTLPSTTSAVHTSSKIVGLSQITPTRQPSVARTFRPLDSLSRVSQHTNGDTNFVPVPDTPNRSFASPQFSRTPYTMDDQTQKDERGSLAQAMEKYSHLEGSTPREKIMNLHARFREKSTFETMQNDPSATPSSVGDIEAFEPPSVPETVAPLSVRVDKEPSHAHLTTESVPETSLEAEPQEHEHDNLQTIHPSALSISHTEEKSPGSLDLGPSEFAVPLPMDSRVKDDYERILLADSEDALGLIGADMPQGAENTEQEQAVSSMQQLLERLSNAATHPDINLAQHMKDAESKLEQEAAWAEYSSAKFLLLNYLIKAAGDHDVHLVIMVRGEKTERVVERYLNGKGFEYTRPREEMGSGTNAEVSMVKGSLSFGVQTAQSEGIVETYKPPSALIALDSSLNTKNPSVEHMRTTFARNGHLLPVIRLMVANSSEHVELCFPGPSTTEHLSMIIQYSLQLRDIVGDLQDDALGVHEDANEIMACLLSDNFNAFWSLPPVEPLRDLVEPDQSETPVQSDVESTKPANPPAQKRLFAEESIEPSSKRPRVDESQDTSQFTDSSKVASQTLDSQIQILEKNLMQKRSEDAAALETLQKALAATESRLQEREKILESLQHRYESRTKDLHKIRQERDRLLETKSASEQRVERQKEDITKLKDERTQLKLDLDQAREALKTGGGDMAELEKAREETRRLTKENASLERKADFANKQAEYTREQYQTASNVAAQSGNELRQLKEENETLSRKVAGEAARLREMNLKNDESHHLSRITELEALLSSREDLLHKKEDELREIRKNRPSTRSTSTQPRSPKLTAGNHSRPTSPGINNNGSNFPGRGSALRFSSEMSL